MELALPRLAADGRLIAALTVGLPPPRAERLNIYPQQQRDGRQDS
jgi:hypothetical protein